MSYYMHSLKNFCVLFWYIGHDKGKTHCLPDAISLKVFWGLTQYPDGNSSELKKTLETKAAAICANFNFFYYIRC